MPISATHPARNTTSACTTTGTTAGRHPAYRSVRAALVAATVVLFAGCGSTARTALTTPPSAADATAATTGSSAPADSTGSTTTDPAPLPATTVTTATAATTVIPATTPVKTAPPTTAAPTTAPPTTAPPTTAPPTSAAPATVPPATVTPASADPIVAVDANGDAVIVGSDGTVTVLEDGTDPDDPLPEEGPVVSVAGVAVTDDLATTIVGTCCEPSPGWLLISNGGDPTSESGGFGHAPAISPDQTRLVAVTVDAIVVAGLDLSAPKSVSIETAGATVLDVEWVDDAHVVALVSSPAEAALFRYEVTSEGLVDAGVVSVPVASALAGVNDGALYAIGGTSALTAYAIDTLSPLPERDIVLPAAPVSAAMHDGELRWIDQERTLHVGETVVAGQYIWVG